MWKELSTGCWQGTVSEQDFFNFNVLLEHLDELKVAISISMEDHGLNKGARVSMA